MAKMDSRLLIALISLIPAGCSTLAKRHFVPPIDPAELDDTAFVHYLASVPTVTVSEASRGVFLLLGNSDRWPTYDQRRSELLRIGALQQRWKLEPDDTLDMGTLAYMLRVICDLSPSVSERLAEVTGLGDRRYALRRCVDAGLLPYQSAAQPVRGGEFVAALTKAEKYVNFVTSPSALKTDAKMP